MKSTTNLLLIALSLLLLNSCKKKASLLEFPQEPAYVTFNLGGNSFQQTKEQPIMLFGCNIALTNKNKKHWHGPDAFKWNTSDQVLSKVPFGKKTDTAKKGSHYYINKYYVASAPVFEPKNGQTFFDIGLVIPDQFIFDGENPVQEIYLDYTPLVPQYTHEIPLKLDSSIIKSKVTHIPFKVESTDFPWINTGRIKNGKGASGIGAYQQGGKNFNSNKFFLPYTSDGATENILKTEVTLLNDIMLYYKFKFVKKNTAGSYDTVSTINLKEYYNTFKTDSVKLIALRRATDDIPCGCLPPVAKDGPYGE